jgi:parallel beta-helix repeat protein
MEEGGSGITVVESQNVFVEGNVLEDTGMRIVEEELSGYGIDVWGCQDCVIRGNVVRKVIGTGILVEESCNVIVDSNTVEEGEMQMLDWWDGGIWLDGGHDVTVRDNTFRNNHGPGIQVSDTEAVYPQGSLGFVLEDNVSQGNVFGLYVWNFGICPPPEQALRMSGNVLRDNQQDFLCAEWECGVGQPCVPPSDEPPPC